MPTPQLGLGVGEVTIPHLLQKSYTRPVRYKAGGGQGGFWGLTRAKVVITFLGDGCVVRIQPTCSSRVAGEEAVSVSNWT